MGLTLLALRPYQALIERLSQLPVVSMRAERFVLAPADLLLLLLPLITFRAYFTLLHSIHTASWDPVAVDDIVSNYNDTS